MEENGGVYLAVVQIMVVVVTMTGVVCMRISFVGYMISNVLGVTLHGTVCLGAFLIKSLMVLGTQNYKSEDSIMKVKEGGSREVALKIVSAVVGLFIGFVAVGNITGAIVVAIKGDDENQIGQIGGIIGAHLGGFLGVYLVKALVKKHK